MFIHSHRENTHNDASSFSTTENTQTDHRHSYTESSASSQTIHGSYPNISPKKNEARKMYVQEPRVTDTGAPDVYYVVTCGQPGIYTDWYGPFSELLVFADKTRSTVRDAVSRDGWLSVYVAATPEEAGTVFAQEMAWAGTRRNRE